VKAAVPALTSKQRFLTALDRGVPDRLPVTTHHIMPYFLHHYLSGTSNDEFFDRFGLDPILWITEPVPDESAGQFWGEWLDEPHAWFGTHQRVRHVCTASWRVECEDIPGQEYPTARYRFVTPRGSLDMVVQSNEYTTWILEKLIKQPKDIDILGEYLPSPVANVAGVNAAAAAWGERGLVRGNIVGNEVFGQGGCWQDAACLVGIEPLIMATHDDPGWVHDLLDIMLRRKMAYAKSLKGANYDVIEHGGGDASSTVISPRLFDQFVAPYDSQSIAALHAAGQRVVYHTCGGMMPLLERIVGMGPDAIETLTPPEMGGDVDLPEVKRRVGDKVCLIGGFDQFHHFLGCTPEETRAAVRRCFAEAGPGGGFILAPSDHFFDADLALLEAFADEAKKCVY
jgi:uroporphyrinogen decarboxylase